MVPFASETATIVGWRCHCGLLSNISRMSLVAVHLSPAGVRPITLDAPATGGIIRLICNGILRRDPCRRAH